jgi:hypothetical protein
MTRGTRCIHDGLNLSRPARSGVGAARVSTFRTRRSRVVGVDDGARGLSLLGTAQGARTSGNDAKSHAQTRGDERDGVTEAHRSSARARFRTPLVPWMNSAIAHGIRRPSHYRTLLTQRRPLLSQGRSPPARAAPRPARFRPTCLRAASRSTRFLPACLRAASRSTRFLPACLRAASRPTRFRPTCLRAASRPARFRPTCLRPEPRPARIQPTSLRPVSRPACIRPTSLRYASRPARIQPTSLRYACRPSRVGSSRRSVRRSPRRPAPPHGAAVEPSERSESRRNEAQGS